MTSPIEIVTALPEVAKAIYSDIVSSTLQEIGKIGVDAVKTFRLALFPLQISAALQDRLALYIDSAIRAVPEHRRISPQQSLALSICDQLKFCDETEEISRLYVELLSRAMDKERVGEAHPAFVNIISQLAPDEILVIRQLGEAVSVGDDGAFKTYFRERNNARKILTKSLVKKVVGASELTPEMQHLVTSICIDPEELAQPNLYSTFLEHLVSLGVVAYTNDSTNDGVLKGVMRSSKDAQMLCIKLSEFGSLFFKACVKNQLNNHP
jgi:hypothetical protein